MSGCCAVGRCEGNLQNCLSSGAAGSDREVIRSNFATETNRMF